MPTTNPLTQTRWQSITPAVWAQKKQHGENHISGWGVYNSGENTTHQCQEIIYAGNDGEMIRVLQKSQGHEYFQESPPDA